MRIISKFHDYYDSAMGFGQDPALIYRRETEVQVIDSRHWPGPEHILAALTGKPWQHRWPRGMQCGLIGFCGHFHLVCLQWPLAIGLDVTSNKEVRITAHQAIELALADPCWRGGTWMLRRYGGPEERLRRTLKSVRDEVAQLPRDELLFRSLGCPSLLAVASAGSWHYGIPIEITTNPRLATLGFQHVLDPFTAFQEIAMFLGSVLATEDHAPRTVGDDRIIAASKGFDDQSFRTQAPGSKKTNRRANRERKKKHSA